MVYILLIWFLLEYPTEVLMRLYINVFLGQGVGHVLNGTLSKFQKNSKNQNIFLSLGYMIGQVRFPFFKWAGLPDALQAFGWVSKNWDPLKGTLSRHNSERSTHSNHRTPLSGSQFPKIHPMTRKAYDILAYQKNGTLPILRSLPSLKI